MFGWGTRGLANKVAREPDKLDALADKLRRDCPYLNEPFSTRWLILIILYVLVATNLLVVK